jgi:hypothetical protein
MMIEDVMYGVTERANTDIERNEPPVNESIKLKELPTTLSR